MFTQARRWAAAMFLTLVASALFAAEKPNILFILADDLGYGDLGCYGQKRIQTPQLDKMAAQGIRFTDCYAGNTVCAPSRCSLMTGFHMGHSRVRANQHNVLLPEDLTVAELLKQAGYHTALIGKWGLGEVNSTGAPDKQGFDEYFGYLNQGHAHNYYPDMLFENGKKVPLDGKTYSHDLFTSRALEFLEGNHSRPFFLYLTYTIPHANNELGKKTGNGMEVPSDAPYSSQNWPQQQKNHAAMITRMDADVGRLLTRLHELAIEDKTIVFFASDNGPHREGGCDPAFNHSSGPFRGFKRSLTEGGIRVPMIVRWPGQIKPGSVSAHPWAFWDFLPTAAEIAGIQPPAGIDGMSVVPALLGQPQKAHDYLYWEFGEGDFQQAVRMGTWKAYRPSPGVPIQIYDLPNDPGEQKDLAKEKPELVARAEELFRTSRVEPSYASDQTTPSQSKAARKAKRKSS